MKVFVFAALCLACVLAEEATEQSEPLLSQFTQPAQSLPQLVAQEEYQRRLGDLMVGSQQAMYFQQVAMLELQAIYDQDDSTTTNAVLDRQVFFDDDDEIGLTDGDEEDEDTGVIDENDLADEVEQKERVEKKLGYEDDLVDVVEEKERVEKKLGYEDDLVDVVEEKERVEKKLGAEDDLVDVVEEKERVEKKLGAEDDLVDVVEEKERVEKKLGAEDDLVDVAEEEGEGDEDELVDAVEDDSTTKEALVDAEEDDEDDGLYLELESTSKPFYSPMYTHGMYGMGMYGMGMGMYGMGMGMGMHGAQQEKKDPLTQALQANTAKVAALKFAHIQISTAAGDVEKAYWMNKMLQTALPPQFLIYKVYKNYLSTIALSLAIQVHDAFTLEAYLENFNLNHPEAGESALAAEARAELLLYSKWHMLAMIRFQLFYMGIYEQYSAMHMQPQPAPQQNPSSFVEVEEEAEPAQFHDPASTMMMYSHYLSMYKRYLQYVTIASELSLTQMGMASASTAVQHFSNPDKVNSKISEYGEHVTKMLPHAMASWASATSSKYMIEYYSMIMDMYAPMFAPARDAERTASAMENTNFVQTQQPTTQ